jgi:hypothetical protein
LDEVEHLVMKALSLGLIKGHIDEIDQTVSVNPKSFLFSIFYFLFFILVPSYSDIYTMIRFHGYNRACLI